MGLWNEMYPTSTRWIIIYDTCQHLESINDPLATKKFRYSLLNKNPEILQSLEKGKNVKEVIPNYCNKKNDVLGFLDYDEKNFDKNFFDFMSMFISNFYDNTMDIYKKGTIRDDIPNFVKLLTYKYLIGPEDDILDKMVSEKTCEAVMKQLPEVLEDGELHKAVIKDILPYEDPKENIYKVNDKSLEIGSGVFLYPGSLLLKLGDFELHLQGDTVRDILEHRLDKGTYDQLFRSEIHKYELADYINNDELLNEIKSKIEKGDSIQIFFSLLTEEELKNMNKDIKNALKNHHLEIDSLTVSKYVKHLGVITENEPRDIETDLKNWGEQEGIDGLLVTSDVDIKSKKGYFLLVKKKS